VQEGLGGEGLIHNDQEAVGRAVGLSERAAGQERGAHGFEISGQDDLKAGGEGAEYSKGLAPQRGFEPE
jgi:hypothetical protein